MDQESCQQRLIEVTAPHPMIKDARLKTTGVDQLEQACLAEASLRFTQAKEIPFITEPLRSIFHDNLNSPVFQEVLKGTFQPPPNWNSYAAQLLLAMTKLLSIKIQPRTLENHTSSCRQVRETTASSMSHIHFQHYMVEK